MRDIARGDWRKWRVALNGRPKERAVVDRFGRSPLATQAATSPLNEQIGPDGIRHELVARIRQEIEAGTYDTEEKWLAAEERLLERVAGSC